MPSLEQIIRPFVVDSTLPPEPYVTTANDPPPDLVRLSIGVGQTQLSTLSPSVAPIVPPPPSSPSLTTPPITYTTESSSYSYSVQFYHDQKSEEQANPNQ